MFASPVTAFLAYLKKAVYSEPLNTTGGIMNLPASNEQPVGSSDRFLISVRYGDWFMSFYRQLFSLGRFERLETVLIRAGHAGLLAVGVLGLLAGIVIAIKTNTLSNLLFGLAWIPLVLVLQYVAAKFVSAGSLLLRASPGELSSRAFLDCVGLIGFLAGLVFFIFGTFTGIREESWAVFGMGTGAFAAACCFLVLTLNPDTLNIAIRDYSSAGQEAIGILTFFMKVFLRLVPLSYGVGVMIVAVLMVVGEVQIFKGNINDFMELGGTLFLTGYIALLPLGAYLLFVLYYLGIDVLRAILSLPRKLDELNGKSRN
jgi:hypothetical protein